MFAGHHCQHLSPWQSIYRHSSGNNTERTCTAVIVTHVLNSVCQDIQGTGHDCSGSNSGVSVEPCSSGHLSALDNCHQQHVGTRALRAGNWQMFRPDNDRVDNSEFSQCRITMSAYDEILHVFRMMALVRCRAEDTDTI